MSVREKLKETAISLGVYGTARRNYHRLLQTQTHRTFRKEMEFYSAFLSPGDLCFDIGANIGAKTEVFLALGARVAAFEPQPHCFRELMARCGPSSRLFGVNAAVGAAPGRAKMFLNQNTAIASMLDGWSGESSADEIEVPVTTLNEAMSEYGTPAFCKIDVEGYELEVLKGLSSPIRSISMEYHLSDAGIAKTIACVDRLSELGELSINVSLGEEPGLKWKHWITSSQFREFFPSQAPRTTTCSYGDVFVRMT